MFEQVSRLYKKPWFRWSFQILLFLLVYMGIQFYHTQSTPKGTMPGFSATQLDGRQVTLPHDLEGATLVHFWATWCTVCRLEQGAIDDLAKNNRVITIASQSGSVAEVRGVVREREITAPVIVDESGSIARRFGIRAFPTSFIVDKDGLIRYTEVGFSTEVGLRVRLWLAD